MNKEQAKDQLIKLLESQVMDLTLMSKIELGDDVIEEIKRLKGLIGNTEPYVSDDFQIGPDGAYEHIEQQDAKRNIIKIDLSGCKNMKECNKAIELITSGKVKIKINIGYE